MSTSIVRDLYAETTARIVSALEQGAPPWVRPWSQDIDSMPMNAASRRRYRGINALLLALEASSQGYPLNRWLTYRQAAELGGQVRKGEHGTTVLWRLRRVSGTADVFPRGSGLRRAKHPKAWVLRKVAREPDDDDFRRYEPGLALTVEGTFHVIESEVRGWGQRDFPRFVDAAVVEPTELPAEARLLAELDAVAREHGVAAGPPRASS